MAVAPNGNLYAVGSDGYLYKDVAGTVTRVGTGGSPYGDTLAVSPDGSTVYVGTQNDGNILTLSTSTFTFGTPIATLSSTGFQSVAVAPNGNLYAVGSDGYLYKDVAGTVTRVGTGGSPYGDTLAVSPDGSTVYVGTQNDGNILTLSTSTFTFGTPIATLSSTGFQSVAVAPNGNLYAVGSDGYLYKDIAGTVTRVGTGGSPYGDTLAVSPDGSTVYVGTQNDGNILTLSTSTFTFGIPIATGATKVAGVAIYESTIYAADSSSGNIYSTPIPSNLSALTTEIATAQGVASTATVGIALGDYPAASLTALNLAITAAQVVTSADAQSIVDAAVTTLTSAVTTFHGSAVSAPIIPTNATEPIQYLTKAPNGTIYAVAGDAYIYPIVSGVVGTPIATGESSYGDTLAVSPDGSTLYVGTHNGGNILTLDIATSTWGTPIETDNRSSTYSQIAALAISPTDGTLYAANVNGYIYKIVGSVATSLAAGGAGWTDSLAISSDGSTLYVGTGNSGNVYPINTAAWTVGTPIETNVTDPPIQYLAMAPNGTLYAVAGDAYIYPIVSGVVGTPIATGESSYGDTLAVSPDGSTLYVGTQNGGNILTLDIATSTWGTPIATGATTIAGLAIYESTLYAGDSGSGNVYSILIPSNLSALTAEITTAQGVASTATIGLAPGAYPAASLTALNLAITAAQAVTSAHAQSIVDAALTTLTNAVTTFRGSVIPAVYVPPPAPTAVTGVSSVSVGNIVNTSGDFEASATVASSDGNATVTIPAGTIGMTSAGIPLSTITVTPQATSPAPPTGSNTVGVCCDFGPNGATFSPPITMKFNYSPANIPAGVPATSLVVAFYNTTTSQWVTIPGQ